MKKVLLTAFDAFGINNENPSEKLLSFIDVPGICKIVLPTIYGRAEEMLINTIIKEKPTAIILLGYSKSAKPLKLELVARNKDSKIAKDNLGETGVNPIIPGAPKEIKSTLPISKIKKLWDKESVTYNLSENAGGFLCNHVSYIALNWLKKHDLKDIPCGFIHIGGQSGDIDESKTALLLLLKLASIK